MKILYLATVRLPTEKAHGAQIIKTCEALAETGIDVELVVPGRQTPITEDPFSYYGAKKNFTITSLSTPDFVRLGTLGFLATVFWFSEVAKWGKSFWDADVIYSRDALVLLNYVLLGRNLVYEAHARPSLISRFVAHRANRLVVISQALKNAYVQAGISARKITVAPDAVDLSRFAVSESKEDARQKLSLPEHARIVLYTGHLYARKGADTLAEAARALSDTLVVFVGGTNEDVIRFRAKWVSERNIIIVGHVSPREVPLYLRAADIVVLPNSATDKDSAYFSSPMKLFEYMASGVPIVASDVPAIREILDDTSAYFIPADNAHALADGITQALNDGPRAKEKGTRAHAEAQKYSWSERAKQIVSVVSS